MLRRAILSILTLYNYDATIFDGLRAPEGFTEDERDALIANICVECAELEVLIPDPDAMKQAITYWSIKQAPIWQHLYDTTQYEYNPIWNKDGTYRETETRDLASTGQTINDVKGFNSDEWSDSDKMDSAGTDTGTIIREHVEQGNIGVTTTQAMIKEEREIALFNVMDVIIDDFKKRFCLLIY